MKFYTYRQNNSGGSFDADHDKGVSHFVVIEAQNAAYANYKATELGLYFDGCDSGIDCSCCGDRWYEANESDGSDTPSVIQGLPVYATFDEYAAASRYAHRWIKDGPEGYVHYADGRVEAVLS